MKNGYCIIDAHCHIYPDAVAERAVLHTDEFYGITAPHLGTMRDLYDTAFPAGIDLCLAESVATTPKQVASIHRFIARCVAESDGRLIGLGTLHPDSADPATDADEAVTLGFRGVKLHPDIQGFAVDDPRACRLYEICAERHLPVLLHTGDRRYDFSNPNRLLPVLRAFPALTFIGAHLGGYTLWEEAWKTLAGVPNFYVDCSSSLPFLSPATARDIIRRYGADRVLFGTDFPMGDPKEELSRFFALGLTEDECRLILSDNARRVFHIQMP